MTKKYFYFVSYCVVKKYLFWRREYSVRIVFNSNIKLDSLDSFSYFENYLWNETKNKFKGIKNIIINNFILLREEEGE